MGTPPRSRDDCGSHRHLWVIDDTGIPYIVEAPLPELNGELPKHTNLTAGAPAYVGGELWFSDSSSLYLSGGSGRYPPSNAEHLDDAAGVFEVLGYDVISLGWDADTDSAERVLQE